jgi:hypothetical protein
MLTTNIKHTKNHANFNNHSATSMERFCALLTNGCVQIWIEEEYESEQQFRDYLNRMFPFHICLYCKLNGS